MYSYPPSGYGPSKLGILGITELVICPHHWWRKVQILLNQRHGLVYQLNIQMVNT